MNNSLLAILLKNFRWLFFRLRLNNPFIVQGVFLFVFALFNLQDTAHYPLSRLACSVYHALRSLSRTFFALFQIPLHPLYCRSRPSRNSLHILPLAPAFVKLFLWIISDFFHLLGGAWDRAVFPSSIASSEAPYWRETASDSPRPGT